MEVRAGRGRSETMRNRERKLDMKIVKILVSLVLAVGGLMVPSIPAEAASRSTVHCGISAAWTRTDVRAHGVKASLWLAPMPEHGLNICAKAWDTKHRHGPIKMTIYVYGVEDQETYRASGGNVVKRGAGSGLTVQSVRVRVQTSFVMYLDRDV